MARPGRFEWSPPGHVGPKFFSFELTPEAAANLAQAALIFALGQLFVPKAEDPWKRHLFDTNSRFESIERWRAIFRTMGLDDWAWWKAVQDVFVQGTEPLETVMERVLGFAAQGGTLEALEQLLHRKA